MRNETELSRILAATQFDLAKKFTETKIRVVLRRQMTKKLLSHTWRQWTLKQQRDLNFCFSTNHTQSEFKEILQEQKSTPKSQK